MTFEVENVNIVFASPGNSMESYRAGVRPVATFYAELLGMLVTREDWFMVSKHDAIGLHLAFGDGPIDYQPPRWPDPEYPQQMHLDFPVVDLQAADEVAVRLGATRLQDKGTFRSYADPIGHPFCLYRETRGGDTSEGPLSGSIGRVVVDCFSPRALAAFYAELLDMSTCDLDTPERVVISRGDAHDFDLMPALAFQHAVFPAPRWPDPAYPQQVHLDIWVTDAQQAPDLALRLGAIRLPAMGGSAPVFADPAGHPFCLCSEGS